MSEHNDIPEPPGAQRDASAGRDVRGGTGVLPTREVSAQNALRLMR